MERQVVWITGASSGIGEALAYAYSELGATLILSSRNRELLISVKEKCKHQNKVHILTLDLEDTSSLSLKVKEAINIYGRIDILINSGGVSQRSLAIETNLETEQRLMNINFWGTVVLSKAVLPQMLTQKNGHLVCISSLVGKFGTPLRSSYSASKHALHGYFDSLRAETPQNIYTTIICPGFIRTQVTINALTANGTAQGTMDKAQENGMSPEDCAKEIIKAINAKKLEAYIGGKETNGVLLKRFFPKLFARIIRTTKVT
ncbi:MAG: SDR family oxidoreductase [Pedobacter sp.]|nr:MAG: SDR family oxidoreductase [Pedobacter sp.]